MPAGFANGSSSAPLVLEEGDGLLGTELEEVVPEGGGADRRDEPGAEHPVVEADGRVHVGGDRGRGG